MKIYVVGTHLKHLIAYVFVENYYLDALSFGAMSVIQM